MNLDQFSTKQEEKEIIKKWRKDYGIWNPFKRPSKEYISEMMFKPNQSTVFLRHPSYPNIG